MPEDVPVILLIAVAALAAAVAVLRRIAEQYEGNGDRTADIVDASIGMYLARRLFGRPTTTRADERAERARIALAAADEAEAGSGGAGPAEVVAPTSLVVTSTIASHTPQEGPDLRANRVATKGGPAPVWSSGSAKGTRPVALVAVCLFVALAVFLSADVLERVIRAVRGR